MNPLNSSSVNRCRKKNRTVNRFVCNIRKLRNSSLMHRLNSNRSVNKNLYDRLVNTLVLSSGRSNLTRWLNRSV